MEQQDIAPEAIAQQRGAALWLTLNRPAAFNSLTPGIVALLDQGLARAAADPGVRAVVLTGAGRAFCAGADLKSANAAASPEELDRFARDFIASVLALTQRMERFPKPIIAAVNGIAVAGGLELILACDIVVAARSARLGDAHANYGLLPGAGSSARLPAKIGLNRASYLMFTGEAVEAERLLAWGLVNEVVPDDGLQAAVDAVVEKIAAKSPIGLDRMKRLMRDSIDQPLDTALQAEQVMSALHLHAWDRREGVQAFTEKRPPRFRGC
ncbi:enoyl-CoA hydratase/isomerase family protein [Pseudorhodoferax sp.]|uniref:enoyl-CoA hydratase/isomerase family protein n=1 Tax=Pseudorhodoferax sp. TaxID=1993553 RepID=UPI002DD645D5|nr:enoyl-CoA hydratase-related protein [Pseudorhodoferax sp.]